MASNYGLNFGFRRSDESLSIREGRFSVPASGTFRQGSLVEIDAANAGLIKASATDMPLTDGALRGLLVQEEAHLQSVYGAVDSAIGLDSYSTRYSVAQNGKRCIIWSGKGVKIWMKNTPASTRADGRAIGAVTFFTPTGLVLGDFLKWDGTKYVEGASAAVSVARITQIDISVSGSEYLEAVLLG